LVIELWWPADSRWERGLSAVIDVFDNPGRPSLGERPVAMAAREVHFR
jgi:hypothetical protein